MVHSWTFQSVWSSGINQESDILKCDFNFLLGSTHGHARGPPRPSWKVYNICWGFATTLLGRSIVYDGSLCQILVSYYESSNFGRVMDISCHWVEAANLFKLNLLYTHVIRSWCNTRWTSSRMKDSLSWRDVTYTYSLKVLLGHLWSAGSFTIPSKFYIMRKKDKLIHWIKWHPFQNGLYFPDNSWKNTACHEHQEILPHRTIPASLANSQLKSWWLLQIQEWPNVNMIPYINEPTQNALSLMIFLLE